MSINNSNEIIKEDYDDSIENEFMNSKFKRRIITGEAGTSKTTTLMKVVHQLILDKSLVVCLAFTHSAVSTMRSTYLKLFNQIESTLTFKTIHSFYQIDPRENEFRWTTFNKLNPDWITIDEFSLIPISYINMISRCQCNLILCGDLLQLNPVDNCKLISNDIFNKPQFKNMIVSSTLNDILQVASHLSNNVFNTTVYNQSNKLILTKNYRNGTKVMNVLNEVLNKKTFNHVLTLDELYHSRIELKDYVILSSRYTYLNKVLRYLHPINSYNEINLIPTRIGLTSTQGQFILTDNINKDFYNNDIVTIDEVINENERMKLRIKRLTDDNEILTTTINTNLQNQFTILPVDYCTIHKSQGRTIKNIIIVLDDLFDISMLYTAITRSSNDVKFLKVKRTLELDSIYTRINQFNLLKQLVNQS